MHTRLTLLFIVTGFMFQPLIAGELVIPGHVQGSQVQVMPNRGSSMESVQGEFGEPDERFGPVGNPAITEWVYGSFRVYFENETVLHSIDLTTLIMPQ